MPSAEITEYDVLYEFTYLSDIESQKEGEFPTNSISDESCSQPTRGLQEHLLFSNAFDGYKQASSVNDNEMLIDDSINDNLLDIPTLSGDFAPLSPLSPFSESSSSSPFLLGTPDVWYWSRSSSPSSPESPEPCDLPLCAEEDDLTPSSSEMQETRPDSGSKASEPLAVPLELVSPQYTEITVAPTTPKQPVSPKKNVRRKCKSKESSVSTPPNSTPRRSIRGCTSPLPSASPIIQNSAINELSKPQSFVTPSDPPPDAEVSHNEPPREDRDARAVEITNTALSAARAAYEDDVGGYWQSRPARSSKRQISYLEEEEDDEDSDYHDGDDEELPVPSKQRASGRRRTSQKRGKVFPCPAPTGKCSQTFTRRGDAERHMRNARIHADLAVQEESAASRRCQICNADLSRSDARKRHSNAEACGKRNISKHHRVEESEVRKNKSRRIS